MKKLLISITLLVFLGVTAFINSPRLIGQSLQSGLSALLKTAVSINQVELCLSCTSITIDQLSIANPDGFDDIDAISVTQLVVEIDLLSVWSNPTIFHRLIIEQIKINYSKAGRRSNLTRLLANLPESFTSTVNYDEIEFVSMPDKATQKRPEQQLYSLDQLTINRTTITANSDDISSKPLTLELAPLTLYELGHPDHGQTASAIIGSILGRLQLELGAALIKSPEFRQHIRQKTQQRLQQRQQ
ncbi:hypothetical protein SIN8267_01639 [Sinobacterium norvegicum]|uniref:AsmA-like C-terminal domain-containing protein n=1 Tax=Sinobacterium norvegicum TaxID=1641715 RepID=A0ABM9AEA1_9GAMM|nr:hypothetical protein [Sinobacterium norvegicum]CAH0991533.1 hypothetical protein SIN8267_01639 [Sinobacterium norvegicum]